ncbi:uncharacterized protein LOC120358899 [Solenopsis invicta]|uniref:uncharacterized protein LOC120358899 n=1 Tax=Solenopsis invicta TaxID=13686 RepID=UPI00193E443A|nr:uncharacterized protein LOC120358899 [Solenopsis invicta]
MWILQCHREDPHFVENIMFTDESMFTRDGIFNTHNFHFYADKNPHVYNIGNYQHKFSINLWAGIYKNSVIGPFELPARVNGEIYSNFLSEHLSELLEDISLEERRAMWFQHDGAPSHNARRTRETLNRKYPNMWIGRGGPRAWPARSPDLTPLDFFLWGTIKEYVYRVPINTVEELNYRIIEAFANITPEMLERLKQSFIRRAELCIEMDGGHFEHLL